MCRKLLNHSIVCSDKAAACFVRIRIVLLMIVCETFAAHVAE